MAEPSFLLYEEEFKKLEAELQKLQQQANAKVTFLVDKNGQLISAVGETDNLDTTSLASLTAGNIAATGGMAQLLGEKEFSILFHEGERDNIHISLVGRVILVVIFDQRSSLGLVRLRVKKTVEAIHTILQAVLQKAEMGRAGGEGGEGAQKSSPFSEITEDDIEKLFG